MEADVHTLIGNVELVEELEQCVTNWQSQLLTVIEEQDRKKPETPRPMAEIIFWQERSSILSALTAKLNQPVLKKILLVLTKAQSDVITPMETTVAKLVKYSLEADENIGFLKTLERHFKVSNMFDSNLVNVHPQTKCFPF